MQKVYDSICEDARRQLSHELLDNSLKADQQFHFIILFFCNKNMATEKNKVIENYILLKLEQVYSDRSQIWTSQHKILKRMFTLRKIPYKSCPIDSKSTFENEQEISTDIYEKTLKVTNLLKRLNLSMAPKCHKVIKTTNHLYVVYDQFPSCSLKDYLLKNHLTIIQKQELMAKIARMLNQIHRKSVVVLNLNPKNVHIKDNGQLFLQNWDFATIINNSEQQFTDTIKQDTAFVADQVKKSGFCSYSSDIYSLGKIFREIQNTGQSQENNQFEKKVNQMINEMTNKSILKRPRLIQITNLIDEKTRQKQILQLKKYGSFEVRIETPKSENPSNFKVKKATSGENFASFSQQKNEQFIRNSNSPMTKTQKYIGSKPEKYARLNTVQTPPVSTDFYQSNFHLRVPQIDEVKTPMRKIHTKTSSPIIDPSVSIKSLQSSNKSAWSSSDHEKCVRNINSKRNLAFLLMDLSQFVVITEQVPELSFLLLKQAFLMLKTVTEQWIKQGSKEKEDLKLENILKSECIKLKQICNMINKMMKEQQYKCEQLKRQLYEERLDESYLKQKIVQFGKAMVVYCQKSMGKESYSPKLVDYLFKTYLILKFKEQGSYEAFWKKISKPQYAFLSNQRYLKDQKSLGYRYLKCKIAEILSKK